MGQENQAIAVLKEGVELARSIGEHRLEKKAELDLVNMKVDLGGAPLAELQSEAEEAMQVLSDFGPSEELSHATALLGTINLRRGEMREAALRYEAAAELGRRGDSLYAETQSRQDFLVAMCLGPHHVDQLLKRGQLELAWARSRGVLRLEATALWVMAAAEAMLDHFGDADELLQEIDSLTQRLTLETVMVRVLLRGPVSLACWPVDPNMPRKDCVPYASSWNEPISGLRCSRGRPFHCFGQGVGTAVRLSLDTCRQAGGPASTL
jgi:hypothetical protein